MNTGLQLGLALLLGALAAVTWVIIDWGAWTLVLPGRRQSGPKSTSTQTETTLTGFQRLTVQADQNTVLVGDVRIDPLSAGRTVLLLHGFGEDRSALFPRAQRLAEAHWNVVLMDSRGRGESGGQHCTFGTKEAEDIGTVVRDLQPQVGPAATFCLWGRSMGAAIALAVAQANPDPSIRTLVLEAPYTTLRSSVAAVLKRRHIPGFLARPMLARASRLTGVQIGQPSPLELAAHCHVPVLILAGSADPIAPAAEIERLAQAFPTRPRIISVPGANHQDIWDQGGPNLTAEILAFLTQATQEPGGKA